jgi:hypothetical protein
VKSILAAYSDSNPERFNKEFIYSRGKDASASYVQDIFKSLEVLPEIKVRSVTIETDEESFGPIRSQGHYYKPITESRFDRIHYVVDIQGRDKPIDRFIFIDKLLDGCFYENESIRFFPIYQIVDNLSYSTENGVSIKSLLMPITLISDGTFDLQLSKGQPVRIPSYDALLFSKRVSPLYYFMSKYALASLDRKGISAFDDFADFEAYSDPSIVDELIRFWGVDVKIGPTEESVAGEGREILTQDNGKGLFVSAKPEDIRKDEKTKAFIGMVLKPKSDVKKKMLTYTYADMSTPWYWIDRTAGFFCKLTDAFKRFEKVKAVFVSLSRLIDDGTRRTMPIPEEDKADIFCIIRYMMVDFQKLFNSDSQNLDSKRIRLYEYIFYPLRSYFSQQIFKILNQPTRNVQTLEKIFSGLTPMFIIKKMVTGELLRYYNATNEMNLYSAYLKVTFRGPQALSKSVSITQRNLHPSYTGRLSLVNASAGDPGTSSILTPFVKIHEGGYFSEQPEILKEQKEAAAKEEAEAAKAKEKTSGK